MKITKSQLAEAIKKEVTRLNKIAIIESRLNDLNKELKILSEGSILLKESYDANKIGKEIDDWIEANSDYISEYSLEDKVKELLGDGSVVTSETKIEKDPNDEEARSYGENWDKTLITIKLNGQDLVKVWTDSNERFASGKNSIAFRGLPGDKIFSAPYGGDALFYFDKSVLNNTDNASPAEAPRQKRPRVSRPSGGDSTQVWQSGLSESDASAIEKLTQNPKFQNVIKYLQQHPKEVVALKDAKDELDAITEGRMGMEMLKDLGLSTLVGGFIAGMFTTIPGLDMSTIIEVILAGAGVGAAAGVRMVANKDYADNLGEIPVSFEDDEDDLNNI